MRCLHRLWLDRRKALVPVKPDTIIARHREGFRPYSTWKSPGEAAGVREFRRRSAD